MQENTIGQKYPTGAKKKILNTKENIAYLIYFKYVRLDFSESLKILFPQKTIFLKVN